MTRFEVEQERTRSEVLRRFVSTLIVATLMTALTAAVLSRAVLGPDFTGSTHRAAVVLQHARS